MGDVLELCIACVCSVLAVNVLTDFGFFLTSGFIIHASILPAEKYKGFNFFVMAASPFKCQQEQQQ